MEERQLLLLCTLILLDVVFMSWRLMTLNPRGMKVIASVQHRGNRDLLKYLPRTVLQYCDL
jgi:hypothetical protein